MNIEETSGSVSVSTPPMRIFSRIRILELALVMAVAFGGVMFGSTYMYFTGAKFMTEMGGSARSAYMILSELTALCVLSYVIYRQGRKFSDIGCSFRTMDFAWGICVAALGYVAFLISFSLIISIQGRAAYAAAQANQDHTMAAIGMSFVTVAFMLINPFFEEVIVRGFLMSELRALSRSKMVAVLVSAVSKALTICIKARSLRSPTL